MVFSIKSGKTFPTIVFRWEDNSWTKNVRRPLEPNGFNSLYKQEPFNHEQHQNFQKNHMSWIIFLKFTINRKIFRYCR